MAMAPPALISRPVHMALALLAGEIDAGIGTRETLEQHSQELRLMEDLGPALDVWVLYDTRPLPDDHPLVIA